MWFAPAMRHLIRLHRSDGSPQRLANLESQVREGPRPTLSNTGTWGMNVTPDGTMDAMYTRLEAVRAHLVRLSRATQARSIPENHIRLIWREWLEVHRNRGPDSREAQRARRQFGEFITGWQEQVAERERQRLEFANALSRQRQWYQRFHVRAQRRFNTLSELVSLFERADVGVISGDTVTITQATLVSCREKWLAIRGRAGAVHGLYSRIQRRFDRWKTSERGVGEEVERWRRWYASAARVEASLGNGSAP